MSLVISKVFTYDTDAGNYIQAVEAADTVALEPAVRQAINNFVVGCKQDGIWSAIKASCILAGARKKEGAFIDLKTGTQILTNNGFADGDYNRKTGLVGNGSSKYLDSNRNNNADPQNSKHVSVYLSQKGNDSTVMLSAGWSSQPGETALGWATSMYATINESGWNSIPSITYSNFTTGLLGASRSNSSGFSVRAGGLDSTVLAGSQAPFNGTINVYRASNGAFGSSARLAFYSIGEAIDLARLDSRVTDLINAFGAAIP